MRHSFFSKTILLSPSLWLAAGATLWVAGCSWSDARETMIGEPPPQLGSRHAPMLNPGGSTTPTTDYDDEGGGPHPWDRNRPAPSASASPSPSLFSTSGDGRHPWDKDPATMRAAAPNMGLMGIFNPPPPAAPVARHVPVENQQLSASSAPMMEPEPAGLAMSAPVEKVSAMPQKLPSAPSSGAGKYPSLSSVPQATDEIATMKQTRVRAKANAADLKRERTLADSARTEFGSDSDSEDDEAEEKLSLPPKPGTRETLPADLPPPSRAMSAREEPAEPAPAKRGFHWPWSKAENTEPPPSHAASGARSPWSGPAENQEISEPPVVKAAPVMAVESTGGMEPIHLHRPGSGAMEPIRLHAPYTLTRTLPESRYAARRRAQASHSESPF